jgi:hypothetical protein
MSPLTSSNTPQFATLRSPTFTGTVTVSGGQRSAYTAKTSAYPVVAATDYCIDCTSGTFTVTLPTAVGIVGQQFVIKNSSAGTITIATTSAQTIDGSASGAIALGQYDSLSVLSDGANWIIT